MMKITLINFAEASMFQLISRGANSILLASAAVVLLMYCIALGQESSKPKLLIDDSSCDRVPSVAFSPDGKTLASGSNFGTHQLWNVGNGHLIRSFIGDTAWTYSAFSPDGKTLASWSTIDDQLKLWDVSSFSLIRSFKWYNGVEDLGCFAFSPDGKTLASGSDKGIKLWDVSSFSLIRSFEWDSGRVNFTPPVAFSPDGKTLASGDNKDIKLWDVSSGRLIL